ncbi:unnamed protein product [Anisakis simplex]|uniref:Ald_Xan_dh_C2 domain-containing protein n=1 Tax=Anisakis simplex TaxID=6269 RepID=A0A0M3IZU2_ANISI|nr:unnamed protein product [Anisakis simplex]
MGLANAKLLIEAPVNGGRNYNGPKVGGFEAWTPVRVEPTLKYHPGNFEVLTQVRYPDRGQCMAKARLTARQTRRAGTKVGLSDPVVLYGRAIAQRIKGTPGITG